jgi:hypothetical protein
MATSAKVGWTGETAIRGAGLDRCKRMSVADGMS